MSDLYFSAKEARVLTDCAQAQLESVQIEAVTKYYLDQARHRASLGHGSVTSDESFYAVWTRVVGMNPGAVEPAYELYERVVRRLTDLGFTCKVQRRGWMPPLQFSW